MSNFLAGLEILWNYYFLTAIVVGISLALTYVACAISDNTYIDTEDTLAEAFYALVASLFGLAWILIVLAIPFIIVLLLLILGKRLFYVADNNSMYRTRARNFKRDNFIYRYMQKDSRTGVDNF